jgi:hypothetical protein
MGSLSKAIADVMFRLGTPDERTLSEHDYIRAILDVDDELVTELNLSSQSWLVPRFPLTVSEGNDIYPISANNFGRPQYLVTKKDSDSTFNASVIHFVDEATLMMYDGGGSHATSGAEFAYRAAVINKDGQFAIRIAPIPSMSAQYECIYEPATSQPSSKGDRNFLLPQFDGYLADRAAFRLAPYAGLSGDAFKRIVAMLVAEIARGDIRFRIYKQSMWQQDNIRVVPFGAKRWRRRRVF